MKNENGFENDKWKKEEICKNNNLKKGKKNYD